jgi:uridine monophosphate synthetase
VKLEKGGDSLGQQYETPYDAITRRGSDIIIVGRGITQAPEPAYAAKQYQEAGYAAYRALFN